MGFPIFPKSAAIIHGIEPIAVRNVAISPNAKYKRGWRREVIMRSSSKNQSENDITAIYKKDFAGAFIEIVVSK